MYSPVKRLLMKHPAPSQQTLSLDRIRMLGEFFLPVYLPYMTNSYNSGPSFYRLLKISEGTLCDMVESAITRKCLQQAGRLPKINW